MVVGIFSGPQWAQPIATDRLSSSLWVLVLSKHVKHVPKHRGAPKRPVPEILEVAPKKVIGTTVLLSSVAVAATGVTIGGGMIGGGSAPVTLAVDTTSVDDAAADTATDTTDTTDTTADEAGSGLVARAATGTAVGHPATVDLSAAVVRRTPQVSRSADRRERTDPLKAALLSAEPAGEVDSGSKDLSDADPRDIARALLADFGFSADQYGCLDSLYMRESGWNPYADNPTSSAYGIPQALPGSKMASAGADWATNPVTQIRWGLGYIQDRYGSPCGAWAHSESVGWY